MQRLLRQIRTEPITTNDLWEDGKLRPRCPYCDSMDVLDVAHTMTCLGGTPDPNHHTHGCVCRDCEKGFTWEHKYNWSRTWEWYINSSRLVLRGIPGCYESYVYQCRCGGSIRRRLTELDGTTETHWIGSRNGKRTYRTWFTCDRCKFQIETVHDDLTRVIDKPK